MERMQYAALLALWMFKKRGLNHTPPHRMGIKEISGRVGNTSNNIRINQKAPTFAGAYEF